MSEITKTIETICNRKPSRQTPIFKGFEPVFGLKIVSVCIHNIWFKKKAQINGYLAGRPPDPTIYTFRAVRTLGYILSP